MWNDDEQARGRRRAADQFACEHRVTRVQTSQGWNNPRGAIVDTTPPQGSHVQVAVGLACDKQDAPRCCARARSRRCAGVRPHLARPSRRRGAAHVGRNRRDDRDAPRFADLRPDDRRAHGRRLLAGLLPGEVRVGGDDPRDRRRERADRDVLRRQPRAGHDDRRAHGRRRLAGLRAGEVRLRGGDPRDGRREPADGHVLRRQPRAGHDDRRAHGRDVRALLSRGFFRI